MQLTFPKTFPVTAHTDFVGHGTTFVAIKGAIADGTDFITDAVKKGAQTVVVQDDAVLGAETVRFLEEKTVELLRVKNCRAALAQLSAQAADFPAKKLRLFGVTGTKGKTTTCHLLMHILKTAGRSVALLSTAGNKIGDHEFAAPLTTAQPDYLHQFLKLCVQQGVTDVVVEVAAQALVLHRVDGLLFDAVVFTNFAREHLEFFDSMDAYFDAKLRIFDFLKPDGVAFVNGDDQKLLSIQKPVVRFGMTDQCPIRATVTKAGFPLQGQIQADGITVTVESQLVGHYNFYNISAAVSVALHAGVLPEQCQKAIATFAGVPGRFEWYQLKNNAICIIDSAHNPLSFEVLLHTVRPLTDRLIVVFGAGGLRDAGRRPLMGSIVASVADYAIITTDNPRTEDAAVIASQIASGINVGAKAEVFTELDRAKAIQKAYALSAPGSFIMLLGKGVEQYQIIGTQKIPFSERLIIQNLQ